MHRMVFKPGHKPIDKPFQSSSTHKALYVVLCIYSSIANGSDKEKTVQQKSANA
jgi:hypothetical protein